MKQSLKDKLSDILYYVKVGTVSAGALALMGLVGYRLINMVEKHDELVNDTTEAILNKTYEDIKSQNTIPLGEDYTIDLTSINLKSNASVIGESTPSLNVYGIVNNQYAFKNIYDLNQEQFDKLTTTENVFTHLKELINDLTLTEHTFTTVNQMSLGLEEEKDFETFASFLGAGEETDNFFKKDYNTTADFHLPLYSQVEVVEENGKTYGILKVEGLDIFESSSPNFGLGLLFGSAMQNATGSFATGYAMGVSVAYANAIEETDTYLRVSQLKMELPNAKEMSDSEIRESIMSCAMNKETQNNIEKTTLFYSENLHDNENKYLAELSNNSTIEENFKYSQTEETEEELEP